MLNETMINVNEVLSGKKSIQVDARVPMNELLTVAGVFFVTIFLATMLANTVTRKS